MSRLTVSLHLIHELVYPSSWSQGRRGQTHCDLPFSDAPYDTQLGTEGEGGERGEEREREGERGRGREGEREGGRGREGGREERRRERGRHV